MEIRQQAQGDVEREKSFHTSLDFGSIRVDSGSFALWGVLGDLGWWEGHVFGFGCGAGQPIQVFSAPLCSVGFGSGECQSVVLG